METKSIFKSKTFIINAIMGVVGILAIVDPELLTIMGVAEANQAKVVEIVATFITLANIGLRFITKGPVSVSGK